MQRFLRSLRRIAGRQLASLSFIGLSIATLFFAASLTPSLLPRHFAVQGVLSGFSFAIGYALGVLGVWLWDYLGLPHPADRVQRISKRITAACVTVIIGWFLWQSTVWQNSVRGLMEMAPLETAYPWRVALIALATAAVLVLIARALRAGWLLLHRQAIRVVPRRVSYLLTTAAVGLILFLMVNKVFARLAVAAADAVFLQIDKVVDEGIEQPTDPDASGSSESLIPWDSIGWQGKNFIVTGPTRQQIEAFGAPGGDAGVKRPLRVYAGLRSTDTTDERARLALQELIRVGGFDRQVLVVATPTGTGWLDPGAVDTLEYLHGGDTAIVSMQYSYLPSWITLLVDPNRSIDAAHALFEEVYGHWRTLPKEGRPRLYLHGLSLGALGSESCADLFTLLEDPIQGGLWSGPPFASASWAQITKERNADSPVWLPRFRDGAVVRFTARENALDKFGNRWSPMRFVYLQHASDPMTWFAPELLYQDPTWLTGERGPDVSPSLRWYPVVTFLQTAFDMLRATGVPHGYGHNFAAASYIDCWLAVTEPTGWDEEDVTRLKLLLQERGDKDQATPPESD
ncbi:hypothetical protein Pla175_50260 [Pirellulimonas nuda]|uniref:Alpha/beta-hydrolase family protein n=1 Tax=Pirellulimonas nuda TaxID=2528009 RepID=A0A518DJH6_9BACT|nr:alpha/beta-hydrolase family protein [Pirellulimonas nuda]QDU91596.1 hypothetical protein Pla175_50260 [Pirellulimonas nuda]